MYVPLSVVCSSGNSYGISSLIYGLLVAGVSSTLGSSNFLVTILLYRTSGMGLLVSSCGAPVYIWCIMVVSVLLLLVLPFLSGCLVMILCDVFVNSVFFDPLFGGDVIFYQHLFWFFGHPEVYVLIIPSFGIISLVLASYCSSSLFGSSCMVVCVNCIGVLGSIVWSHHMFTVGLELDSRSYFSAVTLVISLPTGCKMFNWVVTYSGSMNVVSNSVTSLSTLMLSCVFIVCFLIGGSSGVILGNVVCDIGLHDTYYVIGHFHYVLSLGSIISLLCGVFTYYNMVSNGSFSYKSNHVYAVYLVLSGVLLTFSPLHFLGFSSLPRRICDYSDSLNGWNSLASLGSIISICGLAFAIIS